MSLSLAEVRHIAHLARIGIDDSEAERMRSQLNEILALIERMQSVNTEGVEPMAHAKGAGLRLREDVVSESDHRDAFQAIAPQVEAGLYLVPKVIE